MAKQKGSYKSANNIEVIASIPLDPRVRWDSWDSLTNKNDWPKDAQDRPYLYSGLIVAVNEGTQSNQDWTAYVLNDITGWNKKYGTSGSGWKKIGEDFDMFWEDETN